MARLLIGDAKCAFFESFVFSVRGRGGWPASDHRRVLDAIFWIARTGSPWRDLPEEFGKWLSVPAIPALDLGGAVGIDPGRAQ